MKKTTLSVLLIFIIALLVTSGCGTTNTSDTQPTTATITILSQGTSTQIGGIEVTLVLPSGVSVKSTADSTNASVQDTNAGVVAASGAAAGANTDTMATYSAGKVKVHLVNANGFGVGEFVTVNCDIASGSSPKAADFSVTDFNAVDLNGAAITGLTPAFTADIK